VKCNAVLDDGEAFWIRLGLCRTFGMGLGRDSLQGCAQAGFIDPDLVANFASKELVHWHAGGLAGNIPQSHLDCTDGTAPGFKTAPSADFQHDSFDMGRIFSKDKIPVE